MSACSRPHSRLPSLRLSVKEWQKEKLVCYLLANPLPCYSLKLVFRVLWYDKKDSLTTKQSAVRKVEGAKGQTVTKIGLITEIHGITIQRGTKCYKKVKKTPISLVVIE